MSVAAVVRSSARHAFRRPDLFPRALMAMERTPPRLSQPAEHNFSVRRLHSSDRTAAVRKPATAKATTVEDSTSLKLDALNRSLDELITALREINELGHEAMLRARGRKVLAGTLVAGGLGAYYVKRRFFGGAEEEDREAID